MISGHFQVSVDDSSGDESSDMTSNNLVNTVLPPLILQYRKESEEIRMDYDEMKVNGLITAYIQCSVAVFGLDVLKAVLGVAQPL